MKLTNREMSSFLMYRMIQPEKTNTIENNFPNRIPVYNSQQLEISLKNIIEKYKDKKIAIALSGGIDSAVLAKFMPPESIAYTFKCVVPGVKVTDETPVAAKYARECHLQHRVVEIFWEDFENYAEILMREKGAPIHSIEVQIYKALLQAKSDGVEAVVFGEAADAIYGGLSNLLSQDWTIGDFIERYSFLMPYKVLKDYEMPIDIIKKFENNGRIDSHRFVSNVFIQESVWSYINAARTAGIEIVLPFANTYMACDMDYNRIRSGENKYLVREVFSKLYPNFEIPPKTPMPRPMSEWLSHWDGPKNSVFWEHCAKGKLTGDQKWLCWSLEKFLSI